MRVTLGRQKSFRTISVNIPTDLLYDVLPAHTRRGLDMNYLAGTIFAALLSHGLLTISYAGQTATPGAKTAAIKDSSSTDIPTADSSRAEITKVDMDMGKVTLKHGPLARLGMPAMTMVFKVKEPAQLAGLTTGDQVNVLVERLNGDLFVTNIKKRSDR